MNVGLRRASADTALSQYIQGAQQQIYHGSGEDGAVEAVESAAVSGQQMTVVLHAELALDKGECKVAKGGSYTCNECGDCQHGEIYAYIKAVAEENAVKEGESNGYDQSADAALYGLFGTGAGSELVLA